MHPSAFVRSWNLKPSIVEGLSEVGCFLDSGNENLLQSFNVFYAPTKRAVFYEK
jgi:hypothetical protein